MKYCLLLALVGLLIFFVEECGDPNRSKPTDYIFSFTAKLAEQYGTIAESEVLKGTLIVSGKDWHGQLLRIEHPKFGVLESRDVKIQFGNDAFGGEADFASIQGLAPTGVLGGVKPGKNASIVVDLRGSSRILQESKPPQDHHVLNSFANRTLQLPAPGNSNAITGVGRIGIFEISTSTASVTIRTRSSNSTPVARRDHIRTMHDEIVRGSLFSPDFGGADYDPDGDEIKVYSVEGSIANVGRVVKLPSGATIKVEANGQFTYDPTTGFQFLPKPGSQSADRVTYSIIDSQGGKSTEVLSMFSVEKR